MLIKTHVAPSTVHGLGLFAEEFIPRGTPVWRCQPGFDRDFPPQQVEAWPLAAREHVRWFSFVRPADGHFILSGDHACFMNHSAEPNTGAAPGTVEPVTTVACRDIAPGEELTCDYYAFDADAPRKLGVLTAPPSGGPS